MDADTPDGSHRDIVEPATLEAVGRVDRDVARRTVRIRALAASVPTSG